MSKPRQHLLIRNHTVTNMHHPQHLSTAVLLPTLLALATPTHAQRFDPKRFDADRAAFITREAQLNGQDSTTFFAIFNEMQEQKRRLHHQQKASPKEQPATEDSCRQAIMERDSLDLEMKRVEQTCHQRLLDALKPSLVFRALRAEEAFYRHAFRRAAKKVNK